MSTPVPPHLTNTGTVNPLNLSLSYRYIMLSHLDWICIFLIANVVEHFFICFLPSIYLSWLTVRIFSQGFNFFPVNKLGFMSLDIPLTYQINVWQEFLSLWLVFTFFVGCLLKSSFAFLWTLIYEFVLLWILICFIWETFDKAKNTKFFSFSLKVVYFQFCI